MKAQALAGNRELPGGPGSRKGVLALVSARIAPTHPASECTGIMRRTKTQPAVPERESTDEDLGKGGSQRIEITDYWQGCGNGSGV